MIHRYVQSAMDLPAVLSVDDSVDDTILLQSACRKAAVRFQLQAVNDGQKAIDYLLGCGPYSDREKHPIPVIILLDLKMPRKSGLEVLNWLRAQAGFERLPVAVFTSSQHDADIQRAYQAGADCYLLKPVGFESLVAIVRAVDQYVSASNADMGILASLPYAKAAQAPL